MQKAGFSKVDMTYFEPNIGLFGFGKFEHRAIGIETPLYVRTLVIEDFSNNKTAIVVCEIAAISNSLKIEVLKKLHKNNLIEFTNENLLLSANHTHSAPGGFFHYPFYNFSSGGFHKKVLEKYSESILNAIIQANSKLQTANFSVIYGEFSDDDVVCYNRSLDAYNANLNVVKVEKGKEHLATDREMTLLKVTDENNNILGCINWFGVHTTSCGSDHLKICSDNKGYAATFHEMKYEKINPDFVSIFAQKPCGDITPLTQDLWCKNRAKESKDYDYKHAKLNGKVQFEKADELLNNERSLKLNGGIDCIIAHSDFSKIKIDQLTSKKQITTDAALGLAFFRGTVDGIGVSKFLKFFLSGLTYIVHFVESLKLLLLKNENEKKRIQLKYKLHSTKKILVESTNKRILGINSLRVIPKFADKLIEQLVKQDKAGGLQNYPLTPSILPLQIVCLGQLALIALPAEITTIAGKQLKESIEKTLKEKHINHYIIAPYCNEYSGYITTKEEYRVQCYEGGHTLFGENTLAAYTNEINVLANELIKDKSLRKKSTIEPIEFDEATLNKRLYEL